MKKFVLIFFAFGLSMSFANAHNNLNIPDVVKFQEKIIKVYNNIVLVDQDRGEMAFNSMMNELARVHKAIYSLPYEFSFIKNTIMVEVDTKKSVIAPHFPNRSSYGEDAELGRTLFKEWFVNFPLESKAYIEYVDQVVIQYSN